MATTVWLALTLWLVMMIGELGVVTQSVRPPVLCVTMSPEHQCSKAPNLHDCTVVIGRATTDNFSACSILTAFPDQLIRHTVVTLMRMQRTEVPQEKRSALMLLTRCR